MKSPLNRERIAEVKDRVLATGEPVKAVEVEDYIGNLRGLLSYLENAIDTLEEREAGYDGSYLRDGNGPAFIEEFSKVFKSAAEFIAKKLVAAGELAPPPKRYRFADGRGYRMNRSERDLIAKIARIKKVRSKEGLDRLVKSYF